MVQRLLGLPEIAMFYLLRGHQMEGCWQFPIPQVLICFVDVMDGFRTVAEHSLENNPVCGVIKFSPDCRTLFCFCVATDRGFQFSYRLNVNLAEYPSCTLGDLSGSSSWELESPSVAGLLLTDHPVSINVAYDTLTTHNYIFLDIPK